MKVKKIAAALTALTLACSMPLTSVSALTAMPARDAGENNPVYDKLSRESQDYSLKINLSTAEPSESDDSNSQQGTDYSEETQEPDSQLPTDEPEPEKPSEDATEAEDTTDETEPPTEPPVEETTDETTELPTEDSTETPTEDQTEDNTDNTENDSDEKELYEEYRTLLEERTEMFKDLVRDEYTEESFSNLEKAIDNAKEILSDWDNRYAESKAALENIDTACGELITYMSLLTDAIERGESISPDWYTETSYSILEEALEEGKAAAVLGSIDSKTAEELIAKIDSAVNGLYHLKDKLALSIKEAKYKYDLLYVESSLAEFKAEISRIEEEFTDDITPDEVKKLIDDVLKAYSLLKCVLGDTNVSGSITISDATALQKYIAGLDLGIEPALSDVNFDGLITVSDATVIQQYVAKLIDKFEKPPQLPEYDKDWNLVLVNYKYPIKSGYVPDLRMVDGRSVFTFDTRAADALEKMLSDCRAEGLSPLICSAYRTEEMQEKLFNNKVSVYLSSGYSYDDAVALAKTSVAYPGTSEHQLGLAVDIVSLDYQILDKGQLKTEEQQWLMKNCWKYGFILRYPDNKSDITGVIFEPWHYRYVGLEAAKEIMEKGITLEEYLGFV